MMAAVQHKHAPGNDSGNGSSIQRFPVDHDDNGCTLDQPAPAQYGPYVTACNTAVAAATKMPGHLPAAMLRSDLQPDDQSTDGLALWDSGAACEPVNRKGSTRLILTIESGSMNALVIHIDHRDTTGPDSESGRSITSLITGTRYFGTITHSMMRMDSDYTTERPQSIYRQPGRAARRDPVFLRLDRVRHGPRCDLLDLDADAGSECRRHRDGHRVWLHGHYRHHLSLRYGRRRRRGCLYFGRRRWKFVSSIAAGLQRHQLRIALAPAQPGSLRARIRLTARRTR